MRRAYPGQALGGLLVLASLLLGGCATTQSDSGDPYENTNRKFYAFNDSIDRNFLQPVARGYVKVTPEPVRTGVTNFFANSGYLNTVFNDLLQGKFDDFLSDSGRFIINSTIGIGGLFDPATELGLEQHNEDLGQTFGVWGMGEGAYLTLPLVGPNSVRDLPNMATAMALSPFTYMNAVITVPLGVVNAINTRANLLEATSIRDQAALDPYVFVREAYRQQREFDIYDGDPPTEGIDDLLEVDDAGDSVLKIY